MSKIKLSQNHKIYDQRILGYIKNMPRKIRKIKKYSLSLFDYPNDIILYIFNMLNVKALLNIRRTCKSAKEYILKIKSCIHVSVKQLYELPHAKQCIFFPCSLNIVSNTSYWLLEKKRLRDYSNITHLTLTVQFIANKKIKNLFDILCNLSYLYICNSNNHKHKHHCDIFEEVSKLSKLHTFIYKMTSNDCLKNIFKLNNNINLKRLEITCHAASANTLLFVSQLKGLEYFKLKHRKENWYCDEHNEYDEYMEYKNNNNKNNNNKNNNNNNDKNNIYCFDHLRKLWYKDINYFSIDVLSLWKYANNMNTIGKIIISLDMLGFLEKMQMIAIKMPNVKKIGISCCYNVIMKNVVNILNDNKNITALYVECPYTIQYALFDLFHLKYVQKLHVFFICYDKHTHLLGLPADNFSYINKIKPLKNLRIGTNASRQYISYEHAKEIIETKYLKSLRFDNYIITDAAKKKFESNAKLQIIYDYHKHDNNEFTRHVEIMNVSY